MKLHERLANRKSRLSNSKLARYTASVSKRYDQYCPIAHALELIGDRWALLIVRELLQGPKRYTDLAAQLPGIGTNILAARLRELEAAGLVSRETFAEVPPRVEYSLTTRGRALRPVVDALASWGKGLPARQSRSAGG